jgi:acetyl esterase/lipase
VATGRDRMRNRIDPEVRARLDQLLAIVGPDGLSGIREISQRRQKQAELKAMRAARPLPEQIEVRDHVVPGASERQPAIHLRSYVPSAVSTPAPCIFYVHGGGLVLGSVDEDDARAAELAVETGCIATSVDYRLAPEFPFPAALDDCYQALCWVVENHGELGVDADRVALYGPSAGGALSAASALIARDDAGLHIALLMLISPMLDDRTTEPSTVTNTGFGAWSREANVQAWTAYLGPTFGTDLVSPYAAPARVEALTNLPPTYLDVGDLDLFRDEVVNFAGRLMRSQVPVELHVYPGGIHGGEHLAPNAELSERIRSYRLSALRRALGLDDKGEDRPSGHPCGQP